jgi:thioredoxin 1
MESKPGWIGYYGAKECIPMPITLTLHNFDDMIRSEKPVLIDFKAARCGPCRMLAPIIEEIADEYKDKILVATVDVDDQPELAIRYNVMSIPTVAVFKDGRLLGTSVGVRPKQSIVGLIDGFSVKEAVKED